jgi:hypothetical protein
MVPGVSRKSEHLYLVGIELELMLIERRGAR